MLGHDGRVSTEPLAMKRRLGEPALAAVGGTFTVEETFAEKLLRDVAPPAFDELPVVSHQNIPHLIGMRDQNRALRAQAELGNIAASKLSEL
jgi:hypothetical protein